MSKGIVISLYDFTGEALKPWADDGYGVMLLIYSMTCMKLQKIITLLMVAV